MSETPAPAELIAKVNRQFEKPVLPPDSSWAALTTARLYLQVVLKGDVNALREIVDRVEGKAPNRLDLMTDMRQEVVFRVVEDPPKFPVAPNKQKLLDDLLGVMREEPDLAIVKVVAELSRLLRQRYGTAKP